VYRAIKNGAPGQHPQSAGGALFCPRAGSEKGVLAEHCFNWLRIIDFTKNRPLATKAPSGRPSAPPALHECTFSPLTLLGLSRLWEPVSRKLCVQRLGAMYDGLNRGKVMVAHRLRLFR
jgi:hypothetical protein